MSPLETRELDYFVAVAETLHFSRAAERLGITQPPLSRAIARLERRIGVPLLTRTTRQVTLTAAGEVFLTECRAILAALDVAVSTTRRAGQRRVTLAVRPAAAPGVLPALVAAGAHEPDAVRTEVAFTYDEVAALRDGTADAALLCVSTADPGLETMELGPERPVVLLPVDHPLAGHPFVSLPEIQGLPGYTDRLPTEALDAMVDRVALGRLVVVVGESVRDRLGTTVTAVPVHGHPVTQLVLAWLPASRTAVAHLRAAGAALVVQRDTDTGAERLATASRGDSLG